MMDKFAGAGIYTLFDMHQDVLWVEKRSSDSYESGYWGVPPWVKDKIGNSSQAHPFPYPMAHWPNTGGIPWACGYFSDKIAKVSKNLVNQLIINWDQH